MTAPDQPTATPRTAEQARVDAHIHLQNERIPRTTPEQALIDWATFARTLASELSSAQAALAEAKAEVVRLTEMIKVSAEVYGERAVLHESIIKGRAIPLAPYRDQINQLRARVAELEADKVRLAYVIANGPPKCAFGEEWYYGDYNSAEVYETPYAAIDAAKGAK